MRLRTCWFRHLARFSVLCLVGFGFESSCLKTIAQEGVRNLHPLTEPDPSLQTEGDWVDNRWNRTEVGPFLASSLAIPGGQVNKGLSIKVGSNGEGTVCFDTFLCAYKAGWTGGFLTFAPARFGLARAPQISGDVAFSAASGFKWNSSQIRYAGLYHHGKRVVLKYWVDGTGVLDSPWIEIRDGLRVFTRTLELGPRPAGSSFTIPVNDRNVSISNDPGKASAIANLDASAFAITVVGEGVQLSHQKGGLSVEFPGGDGSRRYRFFLWKGDRSLLSRFGQFVDGAAKPDDLQALIKPAQAQWLPELKTIGRRGIESGGFSVDTLTVPYDNPWQALMFLSGVGFTSDGTAYVCTIHGDVWRVTGINKRLSDLRWKRFATGLFQPLGLQVRADEVFVLGRDQITRLHDLNSDGEADFYENFCNLIDTKGGHNYVAGLEKDDHGNFYFVDTFGVHRVSPDGRRVTTLAKGFRNPNGLGVSSDGRIISVAPQQGNWTPSSAICEIKSGGFYGNGGPRITAERPLGYDSPLCWIPHGVDNSGGSQVWVPEDRWGPLAGKMLHLLWGRCGMMLVLRDVADGISQGAVVPLPVRFLSGPQRGVFNRGDGHLYVAASTGWQTSAVRDGSLQRVRFGGKPFYKPIRWHASGNGLTLTFAQPLDRVTAEDVESYAVYQWNYLYAEEYGSKDWTVADSNKEGRDEIFVKAARLMSDGKTVFLEMPELRPVMQMEVKYNIDGADGEILRSQIWLSINRLDSVNKTNGKNWKMEETQ